MLPDELATGYTLAPVPQPDPLRHGGAGQAMLCRTKLNRLEGDRRVRSRA